MHHIDMNRRTKVDVWDDDFELIVKVDDIFSIYAEDPDSKTPTFYLIDTVRGKVAVQAVFTRRLRAGVHVYHADHTQTSVKYQGHGLALKLYTTLLHLGFALQAGECQSVGSQKLWARLSKVSGIEVYSVRGKRWSECYPCEAYDRLTTYDWDPYEVGAIVIAAACQEV